MNGLLKSSLASVALFAVTSSSIGADYYFRLGGSGAVDLGNGGDGDDGGGIGDGDEECVGPDCEDPDPTPSDETDRLRFISVEQCGQSAFGSLPNCPGGDSAVRSVVIGGGKPVIDLNFNEANFGNSPTPAQMGITFSLDASGKNVSYRFPPANCGGELAIVNEGGAWGYTTAVDPSCPPIPALPLIASDSDGATVRWNPSWAPGPAELALASKVGDTFDVSSGRGELVLELENLQDTNSHNVRVTFEVDPAPFGCGPNLTYSCSWETVDPLYPILRIASDQSDQNGNPKVAAVQYRSERTGATTFKLVAERGQRSESPPEVVSVFRPTVLVRDIYYRSGVEGSNTTLAENAHKLVGIAVAASPVAFDPTNPIDDGTQVRTNPVRLTGSFPEFDVSWDAAHLSELVETYGSRGLSGSVSADGKSVTIATPNCATAMTLAVGSDTAVWSYSNTPTSTTACVIPGPFQMIGTDARGNSVTRNWDTSWLRDGLRDPNLTPTIISNGSGPGPVVPTSYSPLDVEDIVFTSTRDRIYLAVRSTQTTWRDSSPTWPHAFSLASTYMGEFFTVVPSTGDYVGHRGVVHLNGPRPDDVVEHPLPQKRVVDHSDGTVWDAGGEDIVVKPIGRDGDLYRYRVSLHMSQAIGEVCDDTPSDLWVQQPGPDSPGFRGAWEQAYSEGSIWLMAANAPIDRLGAVPLDVAETGRTGYRTATVTNRPRCHSAF